MGLVDFTFHSLARSTNFEETQMREEADLSCDSTMELLTDYLLVRFQISK